VYPADYFPYWEKVTGKKLSYGAFGENLSLTGLPETKIRIGDVFSLGEAEVQCSQPRQPCHKLNKIFEFQEMACQVQKTGFSGWYFRVLKPGWVEPGVPLKLIKQGDRGVTVDAANGLRHKDKNHIDKLREILSIDALSDSWREYFNKALARLDKTL
jgi:MOSC domain-containing protein YiiM